ncbi:IS5/IS1182 family transposase, partial [Micromonospora sp. KC721]
LGLLLTELQPAWAAAREDRLRTRRTRERVRKPGAGRRPRLTFTDRVVITLVHLRLAIPHAALAVAYQVDRSTVTRAVTQVRPLLARRGCATGAGCGCTPWPTCSPTPPPKASPCASTPPRSACADRGKDARAVRRSCPARRNRTPSRPPSPPTATGATLWCGATRPGRMHDVTAARIEGVDALLDAYPNVRLLVDAGYQGLARDHREQVCAPPLKRRPSAPPEQHSAWEQDRKRQSSQRIAVEHTIAELKWWRVLQRFTG